jgi:O-antigen/teichoic acid export membrane protein
LRAGGWTFGGHFSTQFLRLATNLVMTRLLLPQMFGVMALANVLLMGLQLFSDIGLGQGIVQSKRGNEPAYLNTVWTAQILRGTLIWLAALLISGCLMLATSLHLLPPGTAYAEPRLPALIATLSFNALLGGLVSTRVATASRNLALGRLTLMELCSQTTAIVVMIVWALVDRSAWALVGGSIVSSMVRLALSHTYLPGEPNRLHWDRDAFRDIFAFGKWIFVTSILGFLSSNGDRLLLGALVDAKTLGIYVTAYFMVNALTDVFTKVSNSVAYPALSEVVRERPGDLIRTYYKFRAPIDSVSLLVTGLMFSAGHLLIRVLYDNRYQAAGHMLEILSISLFEVRLGLAGTSLMALGKPKLLAPIILVQVLVLFALMPWVFWTFGFDSAIWVIGVSVLCTMPVTFFLKIRHGLFDLRRELMFLPWLGVGYLLGLAIDGLARLLGFVR